MPRAASASFIRSTSSASSSPESRVSPEASAASSSVRLEMLFEPGSATTPSARDNGARSRLAAGSRIARLRDRAARRPVRHRAARRASSPWPGEARAPFAARDRRPREHGFERRAVARGDHRRDAIERRAIRVDLADQRLAVRERDVAPHLRRAGGDPGEIAKAARRVAKHLGGVGARRQQVHERERENMRQMGDRREDAIVGLRIEHAHLAAAGRPEARNARDGGGIGLGNRRQHDVALAKQRREGGGRRPVCSVPAIGWPGTNRGSAAPR